MSIENIEKVVFVGNGLDLKMGYKSSYSDFLNSQKDINVLYYEKYAIDLNRKLKDNIISTLEKYTINRNRMFYLNRKFLTTEVINSGFFIPIGKQYKLTEEGLNKINSSLHDIIMRNDDKVKVNTTKYLEQYFSKVYLNTRFTNDDISKDIAELGVLKLGKYVIRDIKMYTQEFRRENLNFWVLYFQFLMETERDKFYREIRKEEKFYIKNNINGVWQDLEKIIMINSHLEYEEYKENVDYTFKEFKRLLLTTTDAFDERVPKSDYEEFKEFKLRLINYLRVQEPQNEEKMYNALYNKYFKDSVVINFNYIENKLIKNSKDYISIHGNIESKENMVFGFDDNYVTDRITFESNVKENNINFTKVFQQMELKRALPNEVIFPELNNEVIIYVIGHGLSEADYSYFYTLINSRYDRITINIICYKYYSNGKEKDNIHSSMNSLFRMIKSFERYDKKEILHKMVLENRINYILEENI